MVLGFEWRSRSYSFNSLLLCLESLNVTGSVFGVYVSLVFRACLCFFFWFFVVVDL